MEANIMTVCAVMTISFLAGFVQSAAGFGAAVIIMALFPFFFSLTDAATLSNVITMWLAAAVFWRYRKHVLLRELLLPALIYGVVSTLAIGLCRQADVRMLKRWFGVFLIALSLYFLLISGRFQLKRGTAASSVCAVISGITGGLFAIGGPPLSLYYVSVMPDKESYLGTLNALLLITVVMNVAARLFGGFYHTEQIPYLLLGSAAILCGSVLGGKLIERLSMETMKKGVYLLMLVSGVYTALG